MQSLGKNLPKVVSQAEWQAVRDKLLVKEKQHMRASDALAAERRHLPMVKIDKDYVFEGPSGKPSLLDLFDGRRQLIVYHFMYHPMKITSAMGVPFSWTKFLTSRISMREIHRLP